MRSLGIPSTPGVYAMVHTSGRKYIGSTVNLNRRRKDHFGRMHLGCNGNPGIQIAYEADGSTSFTFEILELVADVSTLRDREQFWIDSHHRSELFNEHMDAHGPRGWRMSKDGREKISESNRTRELTAEQRQRRIEHIVAVQPDQTGRKRSAETREKIRLAKLGKPSPLKGKTRSPEFCARVSAAHKGKTLSAAHRAEIGASLTGKKRGPYSRKEPETDA